MNRLWVCPVTRRPKPRVRRKFSCLIGPAALKKSDCLPKENFGLPFLSRYFPSRFSLQLVIIRQPTGTCNRRLVTLNEVCVFTGKCQKTNRSSLFPREPETSKPR